MQKFGISVKIYIINTLTLPFWFLPELIIPFETLHYPWDL
jgi:hypothetical protein